MAWSYSGDPKTSPKDEVRFIIGDTDESDQMLQDEEILYELDKKRGVLETAVALCTRLIAKFAREVSYTIGPESVHLSDKIKAFKALQATLDAETRRGGSPIWTGNTTTRPDVFDIGMNDNHRRGWPSLTWIEE